MRKLAHIALITLFTGIAAIAIGQEKYQLELLKSDVNPSNKNILFFRDSIKASDYLPLIIQKHIKKGHLLASFDSISYSPNLTKAYIYVGPTFTEMVIEVDSINKRHLKRSGIYSERIGLGINLSPKEVASLLKKTQAAYINNGYPFAKVSLSNVRLDSIPTARLSIDTGPLYTINEIHVKGDSSLNVKFISNLVGMRQGDLHNESKILDISRQLQQINYLEEIKPPEILFTKQGTDIYLYLKSKATSSVNGVLGLQPDVTAQKLALTGDLNLKLQSVLNRGELLNLRWQSIQSQTQSLQTRLAYPFLFNTNFGLEGKFDLYKRDSSFLELDSKIGINYQLSNAIILNAFYRSYVSNVLSGGNNSSFQKLGQTRTNLYGIGLQSTQLDYLPNPRKGYSLELETGIGNRLAREIDTLPFVNKLSYRGSFQFSYYLPLYKRHVLKLGNQTDFFGVQDVIYDNELYRFGGLGTQRGFNEDAIYANTRSTFTLEYRFLLDRNSHVFAFGDLSWYEKLTSSYLNDTPYGFGVGFSFSTNLGMFSISYALGKQFDNPVRLADSKIHFGYIAYF